ncbi:MAG: thiamine-phosphate kinase [Chitinispirillaceae bacterium]
MAKPPSQEFLLISEIQKILPSFPLSPYQESIGDDAAVRVNNTPGEKLVLTTDISVQDVHFTLQTMTFEEIGYRAMVSNLSDCAAMGALPDSAVVQLVFPKNSHDLVKSVESIYKGFARACERWRFPIVGGDLSSGKIWTIGITLIGALAAEERVLKRRGIKAGDALWVSGKPGASAAGLRAMQQWGRKKASIFYPKLVEAHIIPRPRIELGKAMTSLDRVHAMMDLSDGLSKDIATLCYENNVGFLFECGAVVPSKEMEQLAAELNENWKAWFFHGGEEYELLISAEPDFDLRSFDCAKSADIRRLGFFTSDFEGVRTSVAGGGTKELGYGSWDHVKRIL